MSIANIFNSTYLGQPNIITPDVVRYGKTEKYVYELSSGSSMPSLSNKVFGVTVLSHSGSKEYDLNKFFSSKEEAEHYIKTNL